MSDWTISLISGAIALVIGIPIIKLCNRFSRKSKYGKKWWKA